MIVSAEVPAPVLLPEAGGGEESDTAAAAGAFTMGKRMSRVTRLPPIRAKS